MLDAEIPIKCPDTQAARMEGKLISQDYHHFSAHLPSGKIQWKHIEPNHWMLWLNCRNEGILYIWLPPWLH